MKGTVTVIIFLCCHVLSAKAQGIYVKTFGRNNGIPVIYLHGGPGGSSLDFEITTAQAMAENGFFVIVYDRSGEGRSEVDSVNFSFKESVAELHGLYEKFKLDKATLVCHSFGGYIGANFAAEFPEKVANLVLVSAPVSMQDCFSTVLNRVDSIANNKRDSGALAQLAVVKAYPRTTIEYSSGTFMLAYQHGLYNTKNPTSKAMELSGRFRESSLMKDYTDRLAKTNYKTMLQPSFGYFRSERYTTLDLTSMLQSLKSNGVKIFGLYGTEDGLFDDHQISNIRKFIDDKDRFRYLRDCGHAVFMDQQDEFLTTLKTWLL